jgi:cation-transporting P-type ATPase I
MAELVQVCQRYGIGLGVLSGGDQIAVQALARRAQVAYLEGDDAVGAIRAKQAEGAHVAFVSDNAGAAAPFAACDLAIGLSDDRARLPARAGLLAPDLVAVAAIIDAGARSKAIVRNSIGVSVVSSVVAGVLGLLGLRGVTWALRTVYMAALVVLADGWLRLRG